MRAGAATVVVEARSPPAFSAVLPRARSLPAPMAPTATAMAPIMGTITPQPIMIMVLAVTSAANAYGTAMAGVSAASAFAIDASLTGVNQAKYRSGAPQRAAGPRVLNGNGSFT